MRGVSLLMAAEDNPLVKKFCDNVYPHLPDDLKGYFNQSFDLETDYHKTVEEVKRNMLFCNELTTQPDFDIVLTINTLDEIISNGRKMLEFVETNGIPINPELRSYLDNEYKYSDQKDLEAFRISDETLSVIKKLNLPHEFDNLFSMVFLRAYCEYLKAETLKHTFEQPEDIEPPDEVKEYFEEYPQYFELSKYPIDGKKRYFALTGIQNMTVSRVVKKLMYEWVYNLKTKKPYSPDSIKNSVDGI